jgi:transcriptional regulator NrdR family protein
MRAAEIHRITCPYCAVGYCDVVGERAADGTFTLEGIREPRKCVTCDKYFRLRPRVTIEGARLED